MALQQKIPLAQQEVNVVRETGAGMPPLGDTVSTPPPIATARDAWLQLMCLSNKGQSEGLWSRAMCKLVTPLCHGKHMSGVHLKHTTVKEKNLVEQQ